MRYAPAAAFGGQRDGSAPERRALVDDLGMDRDAGVGATGPPADVRVGAEFALLHIDLHEREERRCRALPGSVAWGEDLDEGALRGDGGEARDLQWTLPRRGRGGGHRALRGHQHVVGEDDAG